MTSLSSATGKRKRKQTNRSSNAVLDLDHHTNSEMSFGTGNAVLFTQTTHEAFTSFTIKAHEADLNRAPVARSLEPGGKGLMRLEQDDARRRVKRQGKHANVMARATGSTIVDADVGFVDERPDSEGEDAGDDGGSWVDRYDARLLLSAVSFPPTPSSQLPQQSFEREISPSSSTGWTDIPSDDEIESISSSKPILSGEERRREIANSREERLRAIRERDGDGDEGTEMWGGSDEEADVIQTALMNRTAKAIVSSSNAAQLEMRILANHGGDKRFAFLRGRWTRAWGAARARAQEQKAREEKEAAGKVGLSGLADYGDSDEGSNSDGEERGGAAMGVGGVGLETHAPQGQDDLNAGLASGEPGAEPEEEDDDDDDVDAAVKAARKWRAKEWAEMRRKRLAVGL